MAKTTKKAATKKTTKKKATRKVTETASSPVPQVAAPVAAAKPIKKVVAAPKKKAVTTKKVEAPVVAKPAPTAPTFDEIAARAYDIWVRKGRPYGQDHENWKEAEAELWAERS